MSDLEDIDVIDWDEAMQQCGDDEEFLRELLSDLREETDSQMFQMDEIIKVRRVMILLCNNSLLVMLDRWNGLFHYALWPVLFHLDSGLSHRHWNYALLILFLLGWFSKQRIHGGIDFVNREWIQWLAYRTIHKQNIKEHGYSFVGIVRAAHVIKGAASNLMCEQLRRTAMELETTAGDFEKEKDKSKDNSENLEIVKKKLSNLKVAVANYHEYLEEVDI